MSSGSPNALHREGDDTGAREKMVALRGALLRLHKALLEMERRDYEREHGVVSVGERFRLVVDDSQFSWLHNASDFVLRLDEALTGKAPIGPADSDAAFNLARRMCTPTESGDTFQKQHYAAIPRDP